MSSGKKNYEFNSTFLYCFSCFLFLQLVFVATPPTTTKIFRFLPCTGISSISTWPATRHRPQTHSRPPRRSKRSSTGTRRSRWKPTPERVKRMQMNLLFMLGSNLLLILNVWKNRIFYCRVLVGMSSAIIIKFIFGACCAYPVLICHKYCFDCYNFFFRLPSRSSSLRSNHAQREKLLSQIQSFAVYHWGKTNIVCLNVLIS